MYQEQVDPLEPPLARYRSNPVRPVPGSLTSSVVVNNDRSRPPRLSFDDSQIRLFSPQEDPIPDGARWQPRLESLTIPRRLVAAAVGVAAAGIAGVTVFTMMFDGQGLNSSRLTAAVVVTSISQLPTPAPEFQLGPPPYLAPDGDTQLPQAFSLSTAEDDDSETTTTARATQDLTAIEPEDQWVDAGNGVRVPDVLLRIRFCESTNNYTAAHTASSARGAYQFLTGSWEWYGHADRYGVSQAHLATPAQQDEAAVITVLKDGTRPWAASQHCWADPNLNPNYRTVRPPEGSTPPPSDTTTTAAPTTAAPTTAAPTTEANPTTAAPTTEANPTTTTTAASSTTDKATASSQTTGSSTTTSSVLDDSTSNPTTTSD